jgi:hypothetical protein
LGTFFKSIIWIIIFFSALLFLGAWTLHKKVTC